MRKEQQFCKPKIEMTIGKECRFKKNETYKYDVISINSGIIINTDIVGENNSVLLYDKQGKSVAISKNNFYKYFKVTNKKTKYGFIGTNDYLYNNSIDVEGKDFTTLAKAKVDAKAEAKKLFEKHKKLKEINFMFIVSDDNDEYAMDGHLAGDDITVTRNYADGGNINDVKYSIGGL